MTTASYPVRPCSGCGEPVIWAKTHRTGHPIDLDPEPWAGGKYRLTSVGSVIWARSSTPTERVTTAWGSKLYQDHLQTCAKADYLRQKQRAERRNR